MLNPLLNIEVYVRLLSITPSIHYINRTPQKRVSLILLAYIITRSRMVCEESSLCFFFAVHLASWLRGTKPVTLWTQFKTNSIQENGGQQYRGQQKYVSGVKQTHNGGGLERPVMEKKRSMIAFHEGNWLWIPHRRNF